MFIMLSGESLFSIIYGALAILIVAFITVSSFHNFPRILKSENVDNTTINYKLSRHYTLQL